MADRTEPLNIPVSRSEKTGYCLQYADIPHSAFTEKRDNSDFCREAVSAVGEVHLVYKQAYVPDDEFFVEINTAVGSVPMFPNTHLYECVK